MTTRVSVDLVSADVLDRGNHTGEQPISSISGLADALAASFGISMSQAPPTLTWLSASSIRVEAGSCRSEDDGTDLIFPAPIVISGISLGNNAHGHVLVGRDGSGSPAAMISTSIALPSGWQGYRRAGSIRTDASGNVRSFLQVGDFFLMTGSTGLAIDTAVQGNSRTLYNLPVPIDVRTEVVLHGRLSASVASAHFVGSPDAADEAVNVATGIVNFFSQANTSAAGEVRCLTDTLGRVAIRSQATSVTAQFSVRGWYDRRRRG